MRKGTFIATVALLIAIAGAIVAFAAYFKRRAARFAMIWTMNLATAICTIWIIMPHRSTTRSRTATNRTLAILLMFLPTTIFPTRNKLCS